MTIAIKPIFQCQIEDDPEAFARGEVTPSRVNQGSELTLATARVLGRVSAGSGALEELTAAQVKTLLGLLNAALTNAAQTFSEPQRVGITTHTIGSATLTLNMASGANVRRITMSGNPTIANPTNLSSAYGQEGMLIFEGPYQPSFGTNWKFPGGEVPTFEGSENRIGYFVNKSGWIDCFPALNMGG